MNYASAKLEFSIDPLSDTTPSWVDITTHCRSASWFSGKAKDLDSPQAGGATFVLRNDARMFEPEYAVGALYPNIVPLRRFRLSVVTSSGTTQQGIYYATDWGLAYPGGSGYSEVTVTCVDGFGIISLSTLPALDPPDAATLADVQAFDEPFAQYLLSDSGTRTKMSAAIGDDGVYRRQPLLGQPGLALGDQGTSVVFGDGTTGGSPGSLQCGTVPLADVTQFTLPDEFTVEAVTQLTILGHFRMVAGGPFKASLVGGAGDFVFGLSGGGPWIYTTSGGSTLNTTLASLGVTDLLPHHIAMTWDGNRLRGYLDGVEATSSAPGGNLVQGDASEFLYVGGENHVGNSSINLVSHVAFYEQALSTERIAAHAAAAVSRGYAAETAGDRINALATNALWSVAGITPTDFTVQPRMQTGQATLDEITTTVQAETPKGLFYFDAAGNPQYAGWDTTDILTVAATFGDQPGEVPYTDLGLAFDDEIYNQVAVSRDGGVAQTHSDATSIGQYLPRTPETLTGLILVDDTDADAISAEILASFKDPKQRIETLTLNGANPAARAQILAREIADVVRVRRRPAAGATPIDVITTIIGKQKTIDTNGNLTCTWNLARGFNASIHTWRLGLVGYSELGSTTVLG